MTVDEWQVTWGGCDSSLNFNSAMRGFLVAMFMCIAANAAYAQTLFSITPGSEFTVAAWLYQRLADNAPIDPTSAVISTNLRDGMIAAATKLYWFADYPIYRVDGTVPTVTVIVGVRNPDGSITQNPLQALLQPSFNAVPMPNPNTFVPQAGTDHEAVIYRTTTHEKWEAILWEKTGFRTTNSLGQLVDEWQINWGGYEPDLRTNNGTWPCYPGPCYGAVAAGIPLMALSITAGDIDRQAVNHAVGLIIPLAINRNTFHFPAQRMDGMQGGDYYPMEGDIFRLPANIDLNAYPATTWDGVSPKSVWRLFAEAMRDYGMVIYDQGANAVAVGEAGATPQYPTDPYTDCVNYPRVCGATGGLDHRHHFIATEFPWDRVQLLRRP